MDAAKHKRLEAAGFTVGTVAQFLELSDAESDLIESRVALSTASNGVAGNDVIGARAEAPNPTQRP